MSSCCEKKACELEQLKSSQLGVLKAVFAINFVMFFVEGGAGLLAHSTSLLADSLDMLGDASVYAFSIFVIGKTILWKARAAYFKGFIMLAFGIGVMGKAIYQIFADTVPESHTMGAIGALALAANLVCLYLLYSHRRTDVNMRSTWICSRNDIVANVSVLGAAWAVAYTRSDLPDILVGVSIAVLFLSSAIGVFKDAHASIKSAPLEGAT